MRKAVVVAVLVLSLLFAPAAAARVNPAPLPAPGMGILCYTFFPIGAMCFVFPTPTGTFWR